MFQNGFAQNVLKNPLAAFSFHTIYLNGKFFHCMSFYAEYEKTRLQKQLIFLPRTRYLVFYKIVNYCQRLYVSSRMNCLS